MTADDDLIINDEVGEEDDAPKARPAKKRGTPKTEARNVAKKAMAKISDLPPLGYEESRRLLYHGHVLLATATRSKVEPPYELTDFDAAGDYLATLSKEVKWLRLPPRALAFVGFATEEAKHLGRWMDGLPEDSRVRRAMRRSPKPEPAWNPYVMPPTDEQATA